MNNIGPYGQFDTRCVGHLMNILAEYVNTSFVSNLTFGFEQDRDNEEWYPIYKSDGKTIAFYYRWRGDTNFPIFGTWASILNDKDFEGEYEFLIDAQLAKSAEAMNNYPPVNLLEKSNNEVEALEAKLRKINLITEISMDSSKTTKGFLADKIKEIINE